MIIELKSPLLEGQADSCAHCGSELPKSVQTAFCCSGCEAVHALLSEYGLKDYYSLKQRFGGSPSRQSEHSPISSNALTETLHEDPCLVRKAARDASGNTLVFALEGIPCAACLMAFRLDAVPISTSATNDVSCHSLSPPPNH